MRFRSLGSLVAVAGAGVLALAGCTSDSPTPTASPQQTATPAPTSTQEPTPTTAPDSTPEATATAQPDATNTSVQGSGIAGGDPDFDFAAMVWQGYWLSRDHFGPFVMASGLGQPFEPPMDMMQMAMQMVAQNPDDPVMVPENMMPLQAIYRSGSSDLINDPREFSPIDFEAFRLDPTTFDETVGVRGQAETMLKESQWARNFANEHFGEPEGDFGAQQRFMGAMVNMLAQMQAKYAMENLMGEDGLYRDSDGALDYTGNWVMLHALSDLAGLSGDPDGRYMSPDMHPMFEDAANMLSQALSGRTPDSDEEAAAAIRALSYRAWTTEDGDGRGAVLDKLTEIADARQSAQAPEGVVRTTARIVALVTAADATGDSSYQASAATMFASLQADFDSEHGVFESKDTYTVDDVAWILGGLNSLVLKGNQDVQDDAMQVMLAFYEATISLGGMQLSAPPGKDGAMAGEWEKDLPSVLYYHPANTPPPPMVGKLPVPAEEIRWTGEGWEVTSDRFVPAGAMHLANELNWFGPHLGSLPFAPLQKDGSTASSSDGAEGREVVVIADDFHFDPAALEVSAGETVTFTVTSRDTFHTFSVKQDQDSSEDLFSINLTAGSTKSVTHTFDESGTLYVYCKPHESLGMTGEIHVGN